MGEPDIEKMKAEKDVEGLIEALKHKDKDVRWGAAAALGYIGDARALEPLTEALEDEDEDVREIAARVYGYILGI
ncbi:unnamed protein product [marine sediment metagenome]|uniref:HEAT repeat domain-containing protein n=1 Tax=marine sediment metagenome TaxID=412755 RepID=X1R7I4_9ZZZZ